MSHPVTALPLPPSLRSKLLHAGFRSVGDFDGQKPSYLADEVGITLEEALEVLRYTADGEHQAFAGIEGGQLGIEVYNREQERVPIITFCSELDKLLRGGIMPGHLTEFCGVPGVGKTQIGMQLAVDVQIPAALGGNEGEAVYIDTEGSFMVERASEIADALVVHLKKMANRSGRGEWIAAADELKTKDVLARIHYLRAYEYSQQMAAVNTLRSYIAANPKIKLIVIDSVAFHFRQDFEDMAERSRLLMGMGNTLKQIAVEFDIAVVLINQVTTKVVKNDVAKLAPVLGDSWAHSNSYRVLLFWDDDQRFAYLHKSPESKPGVAPYLVTGDGIRGVPPRQMVPQKRRANE